MAFDLLLLLLFPNLCQLDESSQLNAIVIIAVEQNNAGSVEIEETIIAS